MDTQKTNLEISVKELKKRLDNGDSLYILDIREPQELAIAKLNNSGHIPMSELGQRFTELDHLKDREVIVYCRSGGRSANCVRFLRQQGFDHAINLTGGILAWSDEIDPSTPKY